MQGLYKKETQLTSYLSSGNTIGDFQGITEFFLQSGKTLPDFLFSVGKLPGLTS